jgi:hypothetical protein
MLATPRNGRHSILHAGFLSGPSKGTVPFLLTQKSGQSPGREAFLHPRGSVLLGKARTTVMIANFATNGTVFHDSRPEPFR